MTIGYVFSIFIAFLLSLTNNNDVNASITKSDSINYIMLEDALNNNHSVYPSDSLDNVKSLFDMVNKKFSRNLEKELTVERGDSLISLFMKVGLNRDEANLLFQKVKPHYNVSSLKAGQKFNVSMLIDSEDEHFISMESFILPETKASRLIIEKDTNGEYIVRKEKDELIDEINTISGTIKNGVTLSKAMSQAGVSGKISAGFSNIFHRSVNFRKDIHGGDSFKIIYEQKINSKGDVVSTGNILYAALQLRKTKLELYRFKDSFGNVEYYNAKGLAMQRTLHRKPLAFQSARISSPFGKRRHPILRRYKVHWGVDYAAPSGTPIYAAGEGVVQVAKYNGSYGNYIKIRHNSEYSTAYGHMKSFAKGIRPGVRVKQGQVIAYVGSTGRSTGPHLHYEIIQNGKRINPLTAKAAAGSDLTGQNLKKFKQQVASLNEAHKKFFAENQPQKQQLAKK